MRIVILMAGVADPRRPLERPASGEWLDTLSRPATPSKLSPFDEAALEVALKLRDQHPEVQLTGIVTHGASDLALMRHVASFRLDVVLGLLPPAEKHADPEWLAAHAPEAMGGLDTADLILIGREHGDLDDGMTPGFLAARWQLPFIGLAHTVQRVEANTWGIVRAGAQVSESYELHGRTVVSVTNAKENRLRHPLLKNVMMAKKQEFEVLTPADAAAMRTHNQEAFLPEAAKRGTQPCRMLDGAVEEQAEQLLALMSSLTQGHTHAR